MSKTQDKNEGVAASQPLATGVANAPSATPDQAPPLADAPAHKPEAPKKDDGEMMRGTIHGYTVQAKASGGKPIEAEGRIIYPDWGNVEFNKSKGGVPSQIPDSFGREILALHELLSYQAAEALRWWMHADLGNRIKTRLVRHIVEYEHHMKEEGHVAERTGDRDEEAPKKDPEIWTHSGSFQITPEMLIETGWQEALKATQP